MSAYHNLPETVVEAMLAFAFQFRRTKRQRRHHVNWLYVSGLVLPVHKVHHYLSAHFSYWHYGTVDIVVWSRTHRVQLLLKKMERSNGQLELRYTWCVDDLLHPDRRVFNHSFLLP